MSAALRTVVTAYRARRCARHLAGVEFCDSCTQVCDAACRAEARRRSAQAAVLAPLPLR
ncbi:hypothetical protein [Streptomyces sp. WMMB303]|uniref:hypothetical protein n=1 Tax=Streptomyces sp. WMMB303 TaxID=3034154 RepID=UPI0023EDA511|nr:hypothetical protein [Streptomyces sp. WMMB303]MDF4251227.1 hypothetical protein [Streptomyces sp. WMMB303]